MKVKYNKENDVFFVKGEEIFWSSLYILRQDEITEEKLRKRLEVSEDEKEILEEELNDLEEMGLIKRKKGEVKPNKKGGEVYELAKEKASFQGYKQKAIEDIDRVREETESIYKKGETIFCAYCGKKYDSEKSTCPHCGSPNPKQEFHWLSLFKNTYIGSQITAIVVLLALYLWYQDIMFLQAVIVSPFWLSGSFLILVSVLYLLHELGRQVCELPPPKS